VPVGVVLLEVAVVDCEGSTLLLLLGLGLTSDTCAVLVRAAVSARLRVAPFADEADVGLFLRGVDLGDKLGELSNVGASTVRTGGAERKDLITVLAGDESHEKLLAFLRTARVRTSKSVVCNEDTQNKKDKLQC
jgi:hypothetical protein